MSSAPPAGHVARLNRMFSQARKAIRSRMSGLRTQTLVFFTCGMAVVLVVAILVNYRTTYDVIGRINERNTTTELALVSTALDGVSGNVQRQTGHITSSEYFGVLRDRQRHSELELVYAIRSFYDEVRGITANFPFIHSIYLFLEDDYVLCATNSNMQRFASIDMSDYPLLSEQMLPLAQRSPLYFGGAKNSDLPFLFNLRNPVYYDLVSIIWRVGDCSVLINLFADQIASLYTGAAATQNGAIRILNGSGEVVSSADPAEVGRKYAHADIIAESPSGQHTLDDAATQLVWMKNGGADLKILSEVELSVYWQDLNLITVRMLVVIVVGFSLACLFLWLILGRAFRPVDVLKESMARAGEGDYGGRLSLGGAGELKALTQSYNDMLVNIQSMTERTAQAESEKRLTELKALRNQINPHFLFNTLNTIKWICMANDDRAAADCISMLGGIISPMFRSDVPYCTLDEEAQSVRLFVRIMNVRIGGGITLTEDIPDQVRGLRVLRLILQPIAENAITHGFEGGAGDISLYARLLPAPDGQGEKLVIRMQNSGKSLAQSELDSLNDTLSSGGESKGIGLINTARRLYLQYGPGSVAACEWAGIRMENVFGQGVAAVITLPVYADDETQA